MRNLPIIVFLGGALAGCAAEPAPPPPDSVANLAAQEELKARQAGEARQADWQPQMEKYVACNIHAAKGIASQQGGDPLSLAVAARALCSPAEVDLEKALRKTYAGSLSAGDAAFEEARKRMLENNAAVIVAARAARSSAPPRPQPPPARDY